MSVAAALLVIAVLAAGRGHRAPGVHAAGVRDVAARVREPSSRPAPCEATELRRDTLRDELGRPYYLAPDALLWSGDTLLVAGQLSARLPSRAEARLDDDAQNAVLAILQFPDRSVRAFARPPSVGTRLLQPVRAAALGNARWALLLVASADSVEPPMAWLAVLSPAGWDHVASLDLPPDVRRLSAPGSPLDVRGDRLFAAVPMEDSVGALGVLLVEGSPERPRVRRVPEVTAAYAAALLPGAHGAASLLVVHGDWSLPRDNNSMFLHGVDDAARAPRRLVRGGDAPVHHPSLAAIDAGLAITWRSWEWDTAGPQRKVPHFGLLERNGRFTSTTLGPHADRLVLVPDGPQRVLTVHTVPSGDDATEVIVHAFPEPVRGLRLVTRTAHNMALGAVRARGTELIIGIPDGELSRAPRIALTLVRIDARCAIEPTAPAP